jgi:hypothetical protein
MATTTTFTVGRDCSAVLISPYGGNVTLPLTTTINMTPEYNTASSVPLNTPPIERDLPKGHRVTIAFDRMDGTVDKLFSQIEAGWWAGGTPDGGTNASASFYIYVNEATGGQTTYQYAGCSMKLTNSGSISPDAPVKQEIALFAQTRTVS